MTPALSHFWISRTTRRSATRCSINFTSHPCSRVSKKARMSQSSTQFTLLLKIPLQLLSVVPPRLAVDPWSSFAPEREVCRTQPLNVINVVQERCEPLSLIPPCCLTYPLKRAGHAWPALSPGHVTLKQIPLGQPPSVHRLLGLRLGFVRRLCSYYGAVRLPVSVHHRRASLDFPLRSGVFSSPDRHRISRFPLKVLT